MRIVIYSTSFLPKTGGVQTYVSLLAEGFVRAGHRTTVVTKTTAPKDWAGNHGYAIERKPGLRRLWKLIAEADVVQLAGPCFVPLLLSLLQRKKIVVEHHNYQPICPNGLLLYQPNQSACPGHFMARRYTRCWRCVALTKGWTVSLSQLALTFPRRWMCQKVGLNAPITHHVQDRLQLPRSKVIYYGVPDSGREETSLLQAEPSLCFAYVGRLVAEKGLPLLVKAASQLRSEGYDFRLKFIGDGPEKQRLERMVVEAGLSSRVIFTGFLTGEGLRQATGDVTALVMPSIMEETAGLAAMEQMMRGQVVIASDIGGLGEVVDGVGLKFSAGEVGELCSCMRQVLQSPEIVGEMGRRARRRALELFAQDGMVEQHLSAYRRLEGVNRC